MVVLEAVHDCRGTAPVTLVLTVLNAAPDLPGVLASIGGQRLPPAEVLVADRGSTDGTLRLLAAWSPPPGSTFRVINAAGVSISVARNLSIEAAAWRYIAVTHGAVRLDGDWLAQLWAALAVGGEVVAGVIRPVGDTLLERTIGLVQTPLPEQINPARYFPPSTALAFTRTVWDGVGGYPEWLDAGQDKVFAVTLRQAGATTRLVPAAITSWNPRQTLPGYLTDLFHTARAEGRAGVDTTATQLSLAGYAASLLAVIAFRRYATPIVLGQVVGHLAPYARRVWATRADTPDRLPTRLATTCGVAMVADAVTLAGQLAGRAANLRPPARSRRVDRPATRPLVGGPGKPVNARSAAPAAWEPPSHRHRPKAAEPAPSG